MRADGHSLNQSQVGRCVCLVLGPGLETAGDATPVHDRAIGERAGSGVVLEREVEEFVAVGFFEPAVAHLRRPASSRARPPAARLRDCTATPFGVPPFLLTGSAMLLTTYGWSMTGSPSARLGSLRKMAVAVTDREHRRHQLEPGRRCGRLDLGDVARIIVRHPVQDLQLVVREQDPGVSAPLGSLEQAA